jgi:hypothetical protein
MHQGLTALQGDASATYSCRNEQVRCWLALRMLTFKRLTAEPRRLRFAARAGGVRSGDRRLRIGTLLEPCFLFSGGIALSPAAGCHGRHSSCARGDVQARAEDCVPQNFSADGQALPGGPIQAPALDFAIQLRRLPWIPMHWLSPGWPGDPLFQSFLRAAGMHYSRPELLTMAPVERKQAHASLTPIQI